MTGNMIDQSFLGYEIRLVKMKARMVSASIEMESMKAANQERQIRGESDAYGEEAFYDLIVRYGLDPTVIDKYLDGECED